MRVYEASLKYKLVRTGPLEVLDSPSKVFDYMDGAFDMDPTVEWFYVILLNRKNRPLGRVAVTKGTATAALVHPREVFRPAVLTNSSGIIVVHNHPSGDPKPSQADIDMTQAIIASAKPFDIIIHDHIIIARNGQTSFRNEGLI